jgi:thymidylate synthase ThyX
MKATLLRYPSEEDWLFAKQCALVTVNKTAITPPDLEWKRKILEARHSPIRELRFAFELQIPYWVSVHLCRHVHAQPYVRSQRNDRQDEYDRNAARQDELVTMIWTMNAEELMTIANKRLCKQASVETRNVVAAMCKIVEILMPEFNGLLVPACQYNGKCHEMFPCGGK